MYNAHFKFREAPFGVTPDPQFYYSNAVYREALATLCYGIDARKGFIVVAGEAGTGKTTLLRKAMRSFESNIKVAYICNTLVSFTELLRLILHDLGLPISTDDKLTMIGQLNEYLIEQLTARNVVALLIDEAQDLSPEILEELRLLGNLETDKDKLLQMVLIGSSVVEKSRSSACTALAPSFSAVGFISVCAQISLSVGVRLMSKSSVTSSIMVAQTLNSAIAYAITRALSQMMLMRRGIPFEDRAIFFTASGSNRSVHLWPMVCSLESM